MLGYFTICYYTDSISVGATELLRLDIRPQAIFTKTQVGNSLRHHARGDREGCAHDSDCSAALAGACCALLALPNVWGSVRPRANCDAGRKWDPVGACSGREGGGLGRWTEAGHIIHGVGVQDARSKY